MKTAPLRRFALLAAVVATGAHAQAAPLPDTGASVLQMLLGLGAVIAVLLGVMHVLKRLGPARLAGAGLMRVVGGVAVGTRERVVVVELGDTWLVLGVAPGQVRTLHTLPRAEQVEGSTVAGGDFPQWLRRTLEKRK
jgi:flagellar protein FliO/FliZ